MIIALAILAFVLLLIGIYFLVKDFSRFIIRKLFNVRFPKEFVDLGENSITWFIVLSFSLLGLLFYKFAAAFVSYLLSNNLTSFFIILRGVFTTKNELQDPFTFTHFVSGLLLTPALQFITCYMIYRGIRTFMFSVNRRYNNSSYSESDVLYFGFMSAIVFIFLEIVFYSQHIPGISGVAHLTYLVVSKLSFICYFLAIAHIHLLKNEKYRSSLPTYVDLSNRESKVIFTPWIVILITYFIGVVLYLPFVTGTQFLGNNGIVIFIFLLSCSVFYLVMKFFLSNGFNFLGVVMLVESPDDLSALPILPGQKTESKILLGLGVIGLLFAIAKPKLFFLVICFIGIILLVFLFFHILIYLAALGISLLRAKYIKAQLPAIKKAVVSDYLIVIGKAVYRASASMLACVLVVIMLLSVFPKKYQHTNENYINSVFDREGNPLFLEHSGNNGCIPVSYPEIPGFLLKCLLLQEDRNFMQQDSWFPKRSNWHGISPSSVYRIYSGSGGSNLNMQLIKNVAFGKTFPQDVQRKFSESLAAYQLSLQCSMQEILTEYLNNVGFNGGQGHSGIMAASLYTFGLPVNKLNPLEMMYMVATLKRGSRFKTSSDFISYQDAANRTGDIKKTLLVQAESWYKQNLISRKELSGLKGQELRLINKPYQTFLATTTCEFLKKQFKSNTSTGIRYTSSISGLYQKQMSNAVKAFESKLHTYLKNGDYDLYSTALVVNIRTGEVLAHHGGNGVTDLAQFSGGSPMGSIIKPFILLELLEAGYKPDITLYDGKIKGKLTPDNYNKKYSNRYVGINEILKRSLNAPMVNIREKTEAVPLYKKVEGQFTKMGIHEDNFLNLNSPQKHTENEINYPLGSRNMTLYDIAQAYQALFNNGIYKKLKVLTPDNDSQDTEKKTENETQIYSVKNDQIIRSALSQTLQPGGTAAYLKGLLPGNKIFFAKTGTSDKAIHGYTVLCDDEILIVVHVSYGKIINGRLELNNAPAIPFGAGGRSAGLLAGLIYCEFNPKN